MARGAPNGVVAAHFAQSLFYRAFVGGAVENRRSIRLALCCGHDWFAAATAQRHDAILKLSDDGCAVESVERERVERER